MATRAFGRAGLLATRGHGREQDGGAGGARMIVARRRRGAQHADEAVAGRVEHAQLGDHPVGAAARRRRQRQRARPAWARRPSSRGSAARPRAARRTPDPSRRRCPVISLPGTAQLARSPCGHLHGAQDRQVDVAAADHRERQRRVEDLAAGQHRDGLLAGVDEAAASPRPRSGTGPCRAGRSPSAA